MAIRVRRVAVSSDQRCPLCRGDLAGTPAAELAVCAGCDAVHHDACVAELAGGRCGTLGCGRGLAEAQTPVKEEVKGGERSLVLTELKAFALDLVALVVTAVAIFAGLGVAVFGVVELRWPLWTLPTAFAGPLLLYLGLVAIHGGRRAPAPRRRRPAK